MSSNFDVYSAYYDLLYRDKDYERESAFIDSLIREHHPAARHLLDVGCGTGIHDWYLANRGYSVTGIDRSETMLAVARKRQDSFPGVQSKPTFFRGDATDFKTGQKFDAVVSLFDVVSYLTSYEDVRAMFANVRSALNTGGMFIFDCWYGPAVYFQQPGTRVRKLESDDIKLTRIATADFDHSQNRVDVHYEMFVNWKNADRIDTFTETHPMRCFFESEISQFAREFGFTPVFSMGWFTREAPSTQTWSALFGLKLTEAVA
jgi:SAM-dependent methyltransferase